MTRVAVLFLTCLRLLMIEGQEFARDGGKNETMTNSIRRIFYGERAEVSNFRFMVKIKSTGTCGGSIIDNNWVLTASHCIRGLSCNSIEIYPVIWGGMEKVNPSQCYVHDGYSEFRYEHDIGLMRVAKDLLRDSRANAISLPPPGTRYMPGTPAIITGWGKTETYERPEELMFAKVRLTSRDECSSKHWKNHPECVTSSICRNIDLPLRMVCTVPEGSLPTGICFGDSGGPLIAEGNVIGIATILISFDKNCRIGAPSGFLSVVDYLPWIYRYVNPSKDTSSFYVSPENSFR